MAIFAIWMGAQAWEDDSTWQSLGFWAGAGIQIYIAVLKNAWSKLTLSGSVIHAALKEVAVQSTVTNGATTMRILEIKYNCGFIICPDNRGAKLNLWREGIILCVNFFRFRYCRL